MNIINREMKGIFISYRREDSLAYAGRIYERMCSRFGKKRVFMDIDSIRPGDDYVRVIELTCQSCGTLLALIGKSWCRVQDKSGKRRLDDPHDFVRLEIARAFASGIRIIPVLLDDAEMPQSEVLPSEISRLSTCQAVNVAGVRFHRDVDELIEAIESNQSKDVERRRFGQRAFVVFVLLTVIVAALVAWRSYKPHNTTEARQYYVRGVELADTNKQAEAILQFNKALQEDPNLAEAHIEKGKALIQLQDYDEAINEEREALKLGSNNGHTYFNLGFALAREGKAAEAVVAYRSAAKLLHDGYDGLWARNNLGYQLFVQGYIDAAVTQYDEVLKGVLDHRWPDEAKVHYNFGLALQRKGNSQAAQREFQIATKMDPAHYPKATVSPGTK